VRHDAVKVVRVALHGLGLARPCLALGKDRGVDVAFEEAVHQTLDLLVVQVSLRYVLLHSILVDLLVLAVLTLHVYCIGGIVLESLVF